MKRPIAQRYDTKTHDAMRSWLPFVAKTVGTIYLLAAPAILILRTLV